MESPDLPPVQHADTSRRPSIGFPLATALLLIFLFSLSAIISCYYHWDKLRSLRRPRSDAVSDPEQPLSKSKPSCNDLKRNRSRSMTVLMPGDEIPRFIALPCPCEPLREEKTKFAPAVQQPPPKLPRIASSPSVVAEIQSL